MNQQQFQEGLVFVKTLQGEDEVRSRRLQLDRNARLVLILVDGVTPVAELMAKLPGNDSVPSILAQLWREGLIEPNTRTVPPELESQSEAEMTAARRAVVEETAPAAEKRLRRVEPVVVAPVDGGPLTVDPSSPVAARSMPPVGPATQPQTGLLPVPPVRERSVELPAPPAAVPRSRPLPAWWRALREWRPNWPSLRLPVWRSRSDTAAAVRRRGLLTMGVMVAVLGLSLALPFLPLPWHPAAVDTALRNLCGASFPYSTRVALWPTPRLLLGPLAGGGDCVAPLQRLEVRYGWLSVLRGQPVPARLILRGADIDLGRVAAWQRVARRVGPVGLDGVRLEGIKFSWAGLEWADLAGDVRLDARGVAGLTLRSADGALQWGAERQGDGWGVEIGVKPLKLPGTGLELADAQLRGVWFDNQITFTDVNVFSYGGRIRGNLVFTRSEGQWQGMGRLLVRQLELSQWPGEGRLLPEADVDGAFDVLMRGNDPASLFQSARLNGQVRLRDGVLVGMDLVELAQSDSARSPGGGRTLFVELAGVLQAGGGRWQLDGIRMRGAAMEATGRLGQGTDGVVQGLLGVSSSKLRLPQSTWQVEGKAGRWNLVRVGAPSPS